MSAVLSASASVSSSAATSAAAAAAACLSGANRLSSVLTDPAASPVLHRTAQPISVSEFADALRAAAPSRFPNARAINGRRVGLAISGGVDSMALAYLCSAMRLQQQQQQKQNGGMTLADSPILGFNAMIVDHGLRAGSAAEAVAVGKEMTKMGHRQHLIKLRWPDADVSSSSSSSAALPTTALETNARRLRYRHLAHHLAQLRIVSLLLAHHEDDQHETVLMRLLSGYGLHGGIRGLRGMRAANDLPECYGMYGAHRSGFWDDQKEPNPYVVMRPTRRERRRIKQDLKAEINYAVLADEIRAGGGGEWDRLPTTYTTTTMPRPWDNDPTGPAPLSPMDTEDLGIVAYRPLLAFAKDRLVATCMANGVPWFEDHTNADPTLTMRNALRHMVRNHALPAALQKPAILQLAARSDAVARQDEAQARRLLAHHGVIKAFSPNVGTLVVRLPRLQAHARARPWRGGVASASSSSYTSQQKEETKRRRRHLRTVAALAIRSLLSYVTPEDNLTAVSQLQATVDTMFPELADSTTPPPKELKSFSLCGVHFTPLLQTPRAWYLSRAPYPTSALASALAASANVPPHTGSLVSLPHTPRTIPFQSFPAISLAQRWNKTEAEWPWSNWGRWVLYDGRFWIRMRTRLPVVVSVQPFRLAYSKPFREALLLAQGPDTSQLPRFLAMLKAHAPGKVRYTLPGIYVASDIGWALRGEPYWPPELAASGSGTGSGSGAPFTREQEAAHRHRQSLWEREQRVREREQWPAPDRPTQHLLALPTMGVHVPGLRKWVQWEVRYKKVDTGLLEASLGGF